MGLVRTVDPAASYHYANLWARSVALRSLSVERSWAAARARGEVCEDEHIHHQNFHSTIRHRGSAENR